MMETPPQQPLNIPEMAPEPVSLQSPKRIGVIIGIIVAFLLVGGAGAFGYVYYVQPTPGMVAGRMLKALPAITSGEFTVTLGIPDAGSVLPVDPVGSFGIEEQAVPPVAQKQPITLTIAGAVDGRNPEKPAVSFTVSADMPASQLQVGAEFRKTDASYLRITSLPAPIMAFLPLDPSAIENTWVKIDLREIESQLPGMVPEERMSFTEKKALTPEQSAEILATIKKSGVFLITKEFPRDVIGGMPMHHYAVTVDMAQLPMVLTQINQILGHPMSDTEVASLVESLQKNEEKLKGAGAVPDTEIWIGVKDYFPYRITAHSNTESDGAVLTVEFKNFNEPITIETPAESVSFLDLLNTTPFGSLGMSGAGFSTTTMDGLDGPSLTGPGADTDKDGLSDSLEGLFGTDPKKADTDGDGFSDKEEVENGYNPVGSGEVTL